MLTGHDLLVIYETTIAFFFQLASWQRVLLVICTIIFQIRHIIGREKKSICIQKKTPTTTTHSKANNQSYVRKDHKMKT